MQFNSSGRFGGRHCRTAVLTVRICCGVGNVYCTAILVLLMIISIRTLCKPYSSTHRYKRDNATKEMLMLQAKRYEYLLHFHWTSARRGVAPLKFLCGRNPFNMHALLTQTRYSSTDSSTLFRLPWHQQLFLKLGFMYSICSGSLL